jgi:hypothetical protein
VDSLCAHSRCEGFGLLDWIWEGRLSDDAWSEGGRRDSSDFVDGMRTEEETMVGLGWTPIQVDCFPSV